MTRRYVPSPGLTVDGVDSATLDTFTRRLVMRGSLPVLGFDDIDDLFAKGGRKALDAARIILRAVQIHEARARADAFVQYAFRHEQTGEVLENAEHHIEWHAFLDEFDRGILFAPVEHAKTQHIAVGRTLWTLGHDPGKRLAIVSLTQEGHADKIVGQIRRHIESNPRVREVFPDLRPSSDIHDVWGQSRITVERDTNAKDPSVQGLGVYGPINGSRLDGIVLDDILNFENTRTAEQVAKLIEWLDAEVFTRATEGAFIHWIGTPWTPSDPMHAVSSRPGWESRRYSAVENPDDEQNAWRPMWPAQFSLARLIKIYDGTTPINFARKYLCRVRMDAASRFQQAWIDKAVAAGSRLTLSTRRPFAMSGNPLPCFTGVDLGVGQKEGNDLTCFFTIAVEGNRKRVVNVESGRFTAPEIVQKIRDVVYRYDSRVYVEDNAAQRFILQWAEDEALPVTGFTTTAGRKYDEHYGVESIAVEMRSGGWIIPSAGGVDPEVEAWIREMLYYSPNSHTGDRLMAAWFAREAARASLGGIVAPGNATRR